MVALSLIEHVPPPRPAAPRFWSMPTVESLRDALAQLGCSTSGKKDSLQKRLRKARRAAAEAAEKDAPRETAATEPTWAPTTHTFLVTDIEATCQRRRQKPPNDIDPERFKRTWLGYDYPNEIIELPVVALQWQQGSRRYKETSRFHRFVKPLWRPVLSTFCAELTGLEQAVVDQASEWPAVLWSLFEWLNSLGLLERRSPQDAPDNHRLAEGVCWATHGPEDLASFVPKQSWIAAEALAKLPGFGPRGAQGLPPLWLRGPLLDIRHAFCYLSRMTAAGGKVRFARQGLTVSGILSQLGMEFQGRPHSGMCDTENIARILIEMANRVRDSELPSPGAHCDAVGTIDGPAPAPSVGDAMASKTDGGSRVGVDVKVLSAALENTHLTPASHFQPVNPAKAAAGGSVLQVRLAPLRVPIQRAETVLKANVDYSMFGYEPYWWMKVPGKVDWPHPPEP